VHEKTSLKTPEMDSIRDIVTVMPLVISKLNKLNAQVFGPYFERIHLHRTK
jgi:hypothetical protein